MYRPSRFGDEVGGDFYDVFGDGDVWYLAIGDVCGKGPEAAAIMGMTRIALRSLAREDDARPLPDVLQPPQRLPPRQRADGRSLLHGVRGPTGDSRTEEQR